ncbi:MAG: tRNA (N(6)-L-threonylcarbamoyladenosine(37)-C(2))-methylthiotransferase MtaB [Candidatus Sedimenticola sp. (ex Thyasira tokunagai)]
MLIYLKTLGCRLNEAEIETWSRDFQSRGHQITPHLEDADLVVVNTCAVTGEAVRKSRKLMHKAHRDNPHAKLVVSGCYTSLETAGDARAQGVDLIVDNRDKDRLVEIAEHELNLHAMPALATVPGENSLLSRGRQRAFIKVQDGCRYQCTFCIVTVARGEERSRSIKEVVTEINQLHAEGIQEVVLTGVHIGGYGNDCGSSLYELIRAVLDHTSIPRLRLGAVEPWDLPDGFWALFDNPRFMPHLHLPLQSGADTVLRRMARRCKSDEFESLVMQARRQVPDFNVTTDIIVGFPGETDEEWQQTMAFVEKIGFGHLHIFAYSPRPGTLAAAMPNEIPREVIRQRSEEMHQLGERMKRRTLEHHISREFSILIEGSGESGNGEWRGYTPNFLRVRIKAAAKSGLSNSIRQVRLEGISEGGDELIGRLLPNQR